jgi:hypothetical protein
VDLQAPKHETLTTAPAAAQVNKASLSTSSKEVIAAAGRCKTLQVTASALAQQTSKQTRASMLVGLKLLKVDAGSLAQRRTQQQQQQQQQRCLGPVMYGGP